MQRNPENFGCREEADKRFWIVFGDIHDRAENAHKIRDLAEASGVIISGDLTLEGGAAQAARVMKDLDLPELPVYAQIGNMDKPDVDDWLSSHARNLHGQVYELAPGIAIFGIGGSTETPFHTPSEFSEKAYSQWLENSWHTASQYPRRILISHNPPRDSACDQIASGAHVGSSAVRKFIEEKQPDLCICGHIHEAKSTDRIGKTLILNPGMLADGSYVLIRECDGQLDAEIRDIQ